MKTTNLPLSAYDLDTLTIPPQKLGQGHINQTFLLETEQGRFVLQELNGAVFPNLAGLAQNVEQVVGHLKSQGYPLYLLPDRNGNLHHQEGNSLWRVWNYLEGRSLTQVSNAKEATAAGKAFGVFARQLQTLDPARLTEHLPRFHDLAWRYRQLDDALRRANDIRLTQAKPWLDQALEIRREMIQWQHDVADSLPRRVAHYDAKLGNVLIYPNRDEPLAVLDLDTVMPGTPIFDFGDLVRSATCPEAEDSPNLKKVKVNKTWKKALTDAFLSEADFLTEAEKAALPQAGRYLTLLMAIRFLTDFLNGDQYYATSYPHHNLDRAANQLTLLRSMERS